MSEQAPLPYQHAERALLAVYEQAQRALTDQVRGALLAGHIITAQQRRLQLAAVIATLDQLGAHTDSLAAALVEQAYRESAARTITQINQLQITAPEVPGAFASVSREAVQALQDTILGQLRASRDTIGRQVNDIYARAQRHAAVRALLGADGSPQAAAKQLARQLATEPQVKRLLARDGVTGFVDRTGRKWTLDAYTRMAVRTVTRQAVVQGSVDRMAAHGINLARVSTHAGSCEICRPFEGRLVSLDAATTSYEGEAVMAGPLPPYHPNCAHTIMPVAARLDAFRRAQQGALA